MVRERKKREHWTPEKIRVLSEKYSSSKYILEEVEKELPGHSRNSIRLKANRLGLYRPIPDVPEEFKPPLDMPRSYYQVVDSNPLYSIVKEIQLISLYGDSNPSLVKPDTGQLISQADSNSQPLVIDSQLWREVGKILADDNIRRAVFYLNLEGAATHRTLAHALNLKDLTAWRVINQLKALKIAFPSTKVSRPTRSKGGPQVTVYQTPDATADQIQHAMTLHKKLESPQYLAGLNLAQTILNDYPALDTKEISIKDLRQYARGLGYRDPGIIDLAAHQLQEQGIKVWR